MNYSRRALLIFSASFFAGIFISFIFLHFIIDSKKPGTFSEEQANLQIVGQQPRQFEPKLLSWNLATSSAEWETRDSGVSFVFQDKIWTMGGLDGNQKVQADNKVIYWEAPHFNDIWTTENGATWKLEKEKAEWPPRRSMSVVYFKDKLWMFAGWSPITGYESDIWQSGDGINWTKVVSEAAWPAREGQTAEVFQGKIWMFGGVNYDKHETKNDVWYSDNGIDWTQATTTIPWSTRWDHAAAVFKDKIFLAGGMDLKNGVFNDVWVTSDGLNWELVTAHAPWATRQGHSLVVYKDKLWVIGRLNDAAASGANDIWYTDDGINWQKTETDPPWLGREDHSVLVYKDKIFVFAGMGSDWRWHNDVWVSSEQENGNNEITLKKNTKEPVLSAASFISIFAADDGREQVLFQKNKDEQLPLASITKLMTALVASGIYKLDDIISVSGKSLSSKGASGIYRAGDRLLFSDALRALLIASHNEIADAMAEQAGKQAFLDLMNKKASELGLSDTQFINVIGLDPSGGSDSINHSTAFDIYKLLKYTDKNYQNIIFITSFEQFRLNNADGNLIANISSTDRLLGRQDVPFRILGGKTGETPRAKQNLAIVTESPCGGKLFSVVLRSENSFDDMEKLLQYDKNSYEWKCAPTK
ncbi:MAG: serine hydrolase [Candidatus Liptonbacteria bacterium]|nr:serine hydrolase [Candidatus Liptonbacteria bacterium]